jgi:hypothetical protein
MHCIHLLYYFVARKFAQFAAHMDMIPSIAQYIDNAKFERLVNSPKKRKQILPLNLGDDDSFQIEELSETVEPVGQPQSNVRTSKRKLPVGANRKRKSLADGNSSNEEEDSNSNADSNEDSNGKSKSEEQPKTKPKTKKPATPKKVARRPKRRRSARK